MSRFVKLVKGNFLGPIGIIGVIGVFVGIIFPWRISVNGAHNGTWDFLGLMIAVLAVLYLLLLFAHFKWNIIIPFVILGLAVWKYVVFKIQFSADSITIKELGIGLPIIMISSALMMLGKVVLFFKKKKSDVAQQIISKGDDISNQDLLKNK